MLCGTPVERVFSGQSKQTSLLRNWLDVCLIMNHYIPLVKEGGTCNNHLHLIVSFSCMDNGTISNRQIVCWWGVLRLAPLKTGDTL